MGISIVDSDPNNTIRYNISGAIHQLVFAPKYIYPLVTFRILFGLMMAFGTARFMYNGWIEKLFIEPKYHFKFYGFEWVEAISTNQLYTIHWVILISAVCVAIGFLYRASIITFLLSFSYVELIDATNYLNHYYLVALLAFLLCFVPAHAFFSLDSILFPRIRKTKIPAWCIHIIMAQLCIVYFYAGCAKLQADWLLRAMPLSIWLPEHQDLPIIGYFFQFTEIAFIFSWFGALYDLTIWAFLLWRKTRGFAYLLVIIFHSLTGILFNIGMFPWIMMTSTLIFFSSDWHGRLYSFRKQSSTPSFPINRKWIIIPILIYLSIQLLFPLRSFLYEGNVLWHEQGYRFSWRVMAVEKSGTATFYIHDLDTGNKAEIDNSKYLTTFQEKQMTIQPDFILQFARMIEQDYKERLQIQNIRITADIFVALNRRSSSRFIDPNINLLDLEDSFREKDWIYPLLED